MHLEGLVTSLDFEERTLPDGTALIDLHGVFLQLPEPPEKFVVYLDLRRGAEDGEDVTVRIRRAKGGRKLLFDSGPQLILAYAPRIPVPAMVDSAEFQFGAVVIEVLMGNRIAGRRVVQFGNDEEER